MNRPAVFIDRDGTMGGAHTVRTPLDYAPYPGTREAFALLRQAGYFIIIATNQSCIARRLDGGYDFAAEFRDIGADDWFICPHDAPDHCLCRKPETGLLAQARDKHALDLAKCFMIGDRWTDMLAGGRMGMRLILVRTGRGGEALGRDRDKWGDYAAEYVAENLREAAEYLCALAPALPDGRP